jgi:hypothetical protein
MDDWELLSNLKYPKNKYDHTGLIDGLQYDYRICALDSRGQRSEFSDIISGIPKDTTPPKPPIGLEITKITSDSIGLEWNQNFEADLEGYNIYRYSTNKPEAWGELVGNTIGGFESFLDTGLDELTTYYYVVTAFDEVPNESNFSIMISGRTLLGQHGPEINHSVEDFEIFEDTVDSTSINLYNWFKDINGDKLEFKCEGSKHIRVNIIQHNGTVVLIPSNNWSGSEILKFSAFDGLGNISESVRITVIPVNDPPKNARIITPQNGQVITFGLKVNFSAVCFDADLPHGDELTFKWNSSLQGHLGSGEELNEIKLITGEHDISLIVSDRSDNSSKDNITIFIKEIAVETEKSDESNELLMLILILGISIIIILIVVVFIYYFKKHKERRIECGKIPPGSRFSFLSIQLGDTSTNESFSKISEEIEKTPPNSNSESISKLDLKRSISIKKMKSKNGKNNSKKITKRDMVNKKNKVRIKTKI